MVKEMRPVPLQWLHFWPVFDPSAVRLQSSSRRSSQAGQLYPLPCSAGSGIGHFPLVLAVQTAHAPDAAVHDASAFSHQFIQTFLTALYATVKL
jgi:hypothetical protein